MIEKSELYEHAARELGGEFHEDYSGRGMYGAMTPAISGELDQATVTFTITRLCVEEYQMSFDEAETMLPYRRDNLGMGTIFY